MPVGPLGWHGLYRARERYSVGNMITPRRGASASFRTVGAVAAIAALTSCSGGITVPPGSENLPPCEVSVVSVLDLHESGDCDLSGVSIEMPDGGEASRPIVEIGGTASFSYGGTSEIIVTNLGKMGTLVALRTPEEGLTVWGTPAAVDAYMESL